MGTTLTAVTLEADGTALLGHVGDSRAYLMRDGTVTQVTDDHSLVEQLVREGRLSPEEAQHHPQRAIITRALGVDADVEVDVYPVELGPGDRLLICSDGLTGMLSDDTIAATLRRHADPQQAADTLVDMANQAGGDDNITVVDPRRPGRRRRPRRPGRRRRRRRPPRDEPGVAGRWPRRTTTGRAAGRSPRPAPSRCRRAGPDAGPRSAPSVGAGAPGAARSGPRSGGSRSWP